MLRSIFFSVSIALGTMVPFAAEAGPSCGLASFYGGYGDGFAGMTMANGKRMNPQAMISAHRSLPLGSRIRVTNQGNGKSVVVTISDRGPWYGNRVLDLSLGAFARVASPSQGIAKVCIAKA
jgi:rare lipoprotein A